MDQDATWRGGRSRPRPHCARWGPSCPSPKVHSPQFSVHTCCGQMAGWIKMPLGREIGLSPSDIVLDADPAPPGPKRSGPQFSSHVYCGQTAIWMKMSLGTEGDLSPGHIVLDGDPASPVKGAQHPPPFGPCLL